MAPKNENVLSKSKCHSENKEGKQKFFSFRWLLRRSKSSKSTKEMLQSEKSHIIDVTSSKSCDTGLSAYETLEKSPTFLLWKLLPPSGKVFGQNKSDISNRKNPKLSFRSSFSCNDVYGMAATTSLFNLARSNRDLSSPGNSKNSFLKCPSQSCNKLYKSYLGASHLTFEKTEAFLPNPAHNVLCKLCLTMVPASNMYTLQDCSCVFCITCLQLYLTINIKEGNVAVTCPDANCDSKGKILVSEIREIAGEEAYTLFERYKLNRDIELDPKRMWCPSAGCETVCSFTPAANPNIAVPVYCNNCRAKFCSGCKLRWHSNKTCDDMRKILNDEIEFAYGDEESLIKHCPNCKIPIEKDDGCAQMMCYRCKHVFCWHCLESLDDDFLLRHYDKGPCRNKLGHSRASMMWHRTQVVGIFAGFSFLLLMASPFLLLAAPCLICCRCKNKFFYEEATPL